MVHEKLPLCGKVPPALKDRPQCPWCGKRCKPKYSPANDAGVILATPFTCRKWDGWMGDPPFCSRACAVTWAQAVWEMAGVKEAAHFPLSRLRRQVPLDPDVTGQTRKERR